MEKTIPILMYHLITPSIHPEFIACSITPHTFAIQIKLLNLLGFNSINLDQLQDYKNGKITLPPKSVVITFDDCYQESIDYAIPILRSNGFTAVFFVPTDYVGSQSHWLLPELGFEFPIIDWDTIQFMDTSGFQIGSHSITHPNLTDITSEDCYRELVGSRNALEHHLGHEVVHFAYPYGLFNDNVRSIASEVGYSTVCSVIERLSRKEDDPLALPRINIMGTQNIVDFILMLHFEGRFNTTLKWWQYIYGKWRGIGRFKNRIKARFTKRN